jgi:serine/threonine protein kinase
MPPQPPPEEQPTTADDPGATVDPPGASSAGAAVAPSRLGDYEVLEEIARGGMGVVYRARQVSLNRIVALKMILAGSHAGREDVERFYREARTVAALDHPGIVPVFEVGALGGQPFYAMALVEGGSLQQRLSRGPLPPTEAARLVKLIAEAVQHAHQKGVVHRDLKPQNVLLAATPGAGPTPRVTDFGLARLADAGEGQTASGAVMGTPGFMPPEQAAGRVREVGPWSDVYSLGAVLYACLTQRPPFQGADRLETLSLVLSQEPTPPRRLNPAVPADLETVCLRCLEKEPAQRYESAAALAADLGRFLAGEPVRARRVGLAERALKWARRRPAAAAYGLGLLALLLGVGGGGAAWLCRSCRMVQACRTCGRS